MGANVVGSIFIIILLALNVSSDDIKPMEGGGFVLCGKKRKGARGSHNAGMGGGCGGRRGKWAKGGQREGEGVVGIGRVPEWTVIAGFTRSFELLAIGLE